MMSKKKDNGVPGLCRTRWSRSINPADTWKEYPRPAMVRASYINLNGMWDYCFTPSPNIPARFEGQLPVPFSPEAPLSGVGRKLSPDEFLWYRRSFTLRKQQKDQRVLLHFGAVDQECAVFVNGKPAGEHTGGYLPFTLDITDITVEASNEILVRVRDYSDTSCYSRGKQKLDKGGMFYTAQSGIWQTVWLELVPDPYISAVHFTPDYDGSCCRVRITAGGRRKGGPIRCTVRPETGGGQTIPGRSGASRSRQTVLRRSVCPYLFPGPGGSPAPAWFPCLDPGGSLPLPCNPGNGGRQGGMLFCHAQMRYPDRQRRPAPYFPE